MSDSNRSKPGPEPPATDDGFTAADFEKMGADRKRQFSDRLERLGAFRDLGAAERDRLTDIVLDLAGDYSWVHEYPHADKWLRIDRKVGPGQRRKFARKVKDALAAVDVALAYVAQIGSGDHRNELLGRNLNGFATPYLSGAKVALQNILHDFEYFIAPASEKFTPGSESMFAEKRPEVRGVLQDFFIKECGLTESNASQRTARIGNEFGWWPPVAESDPDSSNPTRSRAILRSASRRRAKRR